MAGRGPAPADNRRRPNEPERGDWVSTPGIGWQHGDIPKAPTDLRPASRSTWTVWFQAWFAAHWSPDDLPILRQIIKLYDKAERDQASAAELTQFRQLIDSYGITPKGQQDRRWAPPKPDEAPLETTTPDAGPYAGLRVVNG